MKSSFDVVVVGGGSAGMVASMQAARAGAQTLLIEKTSCLGGTTTNGAVNFPGLYHAWGKQIIKGIGWELVEACVRETGDTLPDFLSVPKSHSHHQILVDRAIYTALCDEWVSASGAQILFHAMVAEVEEHADAKTLTVCTKSGLEKIKTKVIIDATGDANVVGLAGFETVTSDELQPGTLSCYVSGFELSTLDAKQINANFSGAVDAGELKVTDVGWNTRQADVMAWLRKRGMNANHIPGIDARSSEGKTEMELEGRRSFLRLYRFLRKQVGLEGLRVEYLAPECGVRETVRIVGETIITVDDYTSGRIWKDSLCYAFYPIDLHVHTAQGLDCRKLAQGVVPTIPRSALMPKGSRNWLVAGRCLSSDRLANSALRVQASCMAMGQAAGATAALAAREGCMLGDVALDSIRSLLKENDAVVPEAGERCVS